MTLVLVASVLKLLSGAGVLRARRYRFVLVRIIVTLLSSTWLPAALVRGRCKAC